MIRKTKEFLRRGLWEVEREKLPRSRRALLQAGQLAIVVLREFTADRCLVWAAGLTYFTLLAIVPLFALAFSVLSGLGAQNVLEPIILERLTTGAEEIVNPIIEYINRTNFGQLGAIGLLTFFMAIVALLTNVEASFNSLWATRETRSVFRRFADYISVLLMTPVLIFVAISMTSTLASQSFIQVLMEQAVVGQFIFYLFRIVPFVVMWAAFTFLYIFMPNIKVHFRAALVGGILGGTLWQLAQWGYVEFQVGVARYNAIYGTLAALPILMVWIYVSWIIVLFGAEVAYAWQNLNAIRREVREEKISFTSQEMVALTILMKATENFYRGERPWTVERIAEALHLPPRLAREIIQELVDLGYLTEVTDEEEGSRFQPGRPPETIEVHRIVQDFRTCGVDLAKERLREWNAVRALEKRLEQADEGALEGMTLKALAMRNQEPGGKTSES